MLRLDVSDKVWQMITGDYIWLQWLQMITDDYMWLQVITGDCMLLQVITDDYMWLQVIICDYRGGFYQTGAYLGRIGGTSV